VFLTTHDSMLNIYHLSLFIRSLLMGDS